MLPNGRKAEGETQALELIYHPPPNPPPLISASVGSMLVGLGLSETVGFVKQLGLSSWAG